MPAQVTWSLAFPVSHSASSSMLETTFQMVNSYLFCCDSSTRLFQRLHMIKFIWEMVAEITVKDCGNETRKDGQLDIHCAGNTLCWIVPVRVRIPRYLSTNPPPSLGHLIITLCLVQVGWHAPIARWPPLGTEMHKASVGIRTTYKCQPGWAEVISTEHPQPLLCISLLLPTLIAVNKWVNKAQSLLRGAHTSMGS